VKALLLPAVAAVMGVGALVWLAPRVHPAHAWGYRVDREQAIALAQAQATALGVSTAGWNAYVTSETQTELDYYERIHPDDAAARNLSPYLADVLLASPDHQRSLFVQFYPNGRVASWERKEAGSQAWTMKTMQSAVDKAFHQVAGPDATAYHAITEGAPTKEGLRFTWERSGASSDFQPTIDVIVQSGAVVHAETHYTFRKPFEDAYDNRDSSNDWFNLGYGALYFILGLAAVILYAIGSIRRRVKQRFAITLGAVNLLSVAVVFWLGSGLEHLQWVRALQTADDYFSQSSGALYQFVVALLLALVAAGGGLFGAGVLREKWWALRLLLSRRAWSRQVGRSVSAGVLTAPLLCAVPCLVAMLAPSSLWEQRQNLALFSPHPILETFSYLLHPTALIFFGVVFGLVWNGVSTPRLRYLITAPLAVVFFIGFHGVLHAPAGAILLEGACMAALQVWLFLRFDVLAIIAAETGMLMINMATIGLLQPSARLAATGWQLVGLLLTLLGGGLVLLLKAPDVPDEEATAPELLNVQSEREELQSEFLIAQRAQREMLPSEAPRIPGFSLAASCTPAREVGGDLYDFLPLSRGRLAIAVADVSGKGVPAALYMTLTKGLLAATTQDNLQLSSILEQVNAHLCTVGQRKTFVTMALGILDPSTRTLEYGRAGHNPVVWRRRLAGTTSLLSPKGLGLGITAGRVFGRTLAVEKLDLESGDTLVFYSDGLTEAMNADLEQFGEERLMSVVEKSGDLAAGPARDAILGEVAGFLNGRPAQDDLTLVVLHVD
jgi:serine phosphatase RsbU (regulator of sigma subunit)